MLNGALLRDDEDIRRHCGDRTLRAIEDFRRQAVALLPLCELVPGFTPRDNAHPWAPRTCEEILDEIPDPVARQYLKISAHSDMATEPHLTNGLIGLRNVLKSVTGYGAQYTIEGGMEMFPRRLAASLAAHQDRARRAGRARVENADRSYSVWFRRDRCLVQQDFDAVVVALPYNRLLEIEWAGERLRRAMTKHVAYYDHPGSLPAHIHPVRSTLLAAIDRRVPGSCSMRSVAAACTTKVRAAVPADMACSAGCWQVPTPCRLCNADDRTLIARAIESLAG